MAARPKSARVILLGDSGVGKSSIMIRYVNGSFDKARAPTVGVDFLSKTQHVADGDEINLQIYDTAGQEKFHALIPGFQRDADVCVLVYDVAQPPSLLGVRKWYEQASGECRAGIPFILCGNKVDLERQVPHDAAEALARELQAVRYLDVSAKTGQGVDLLFQFVAEAAIIIPRPAPGLVVEPPPTPRRCGC